MHAGADYGQDTALADANGTVGIYHVINRGLNNSRILSTPEEKDAFRELLSALKRGHKLNIYHYVIMSNHFHLAVEALNIEDLSRYVGSVCALYSRRWAQSPWWRREGHFGRAGLEASWFKRLAIWTGLAVISREIRWLPRSRVSIALKTMNGPPPPLIYSAGRMRWWTRALILIGASWGADEMARRVFYAKHLSCPDDEAAKLFGGCGTIIGDDEFVLQKFSRNGRLIDKRAGRPKANNNSVKC